MKIGSRAKKTILTLIVIVVIIVVIVLLLSEIDRRRPRKVPCPPKMYYGHGSWITAPFNVFTSLTVKHPRDLNSVGDMERCFPEHHILQSRWRDIRDEVLRSYRQGDMKQIKGDLFFQKIADSKWKRFNIKWYSDSLSDAREKLPLTTKLIDSIPKIKSAMISVLEPGSRIPQHCGPSRNSWRYHLGLVVPKDRENCWIKVDGKKYSWTEGEDVLFDDTCVHEVHNNTKELRIVLFCDVQRELNSAPAQLVNDFVCKIAKITTRNNK